MSSFNGPPVPERLHSCSDAVANDNVKKVLLRRASDMSKLKSKPPKLPPLRKESIKSVGLNSPFKSRDKPTLPPKVDPKDKKKHNSKKKKEQKHVKAPAPPPRLDINRSTVCTPLHQEEHYTFEKQDSTKSQKQHRPDTIGRSRSSSVENCYVEEPTADKKRKSEHSLQNRTSLDRANSGKHHQHSKEDQVFDSVDQDNDSPFNENESETGTDFTNNSQRPLSIKSTASSSPSESVTVDMRCYRGNEAVQNKYRYLISNKDALSYRRNQFHWFRTCKAVSIIAFCMGLVCGALVAGLIYHYCIAGRGPNVHLQDTISLPAADQIHQNFDTTQITALVGSADGEPIIISTGTTTSSADLPEDERIMTGFNTATDVPSSLLSETRIDPGVTEMVKNENLTANGAMTTIVQAVLPGQDNLNSTTVTPISKTVRPRLSRPKKIPYGIPG